MKKSRLKIILFNVLSIFLILVIGEFCFFIIFRNTVKYNLYEHLDRYIKYTKPIQYSYDIVKDQFRVHKGNSGKKPIIFLGGSYTYGDGLKDNQTFAYKVNQLTGRTTYRRGICGCGLREMLDQLETGLLKKDAPDAEYIVYTFINAHINRIYNSKIDSVDTFIPIKYKLKDGNLEKETKANFPYLYSLFSVKFLQYYLAGILDEREYLKDCPLFLTFMEECMKYYKEQYPNAKVILLLYPQGNPYRDIEKGSPEDIENPILPTYVTEYLEDIGYIVVNAEDLTDEPIRKVEYRVEDKEHPNEKAWDAVAPAFVKKFNL